jgi:hypothetical protein
MSDENLITAYAYSNLQRAILTTMLADAIKDSEDPAQTLQEYYGSIAEHLRTAEFPPEDPNVHKIRAEALTLARRFFQDVESLLLRWGRLSERKLILLD